ncbi:hypothetical protein AALP_AAs75065U000300 [Arabis alpina]|uniref:ADP-ribosyl cyclase/cyclic ADP-ribose hydrolase n=1 Tax=Arabis alpina TaxID=50452 RepID=A0A087FY02_ARAAL|nr:hypothetical protein AALP_AAs75065U000300 [Arabis alpina]
MAFSSLSSSTSTWKYDVFPSFSGEDVRKSFLSHFLEKLQGKSIITFIDNRIERSRTIELELLLAIRKSRISIVVFSNKYASSTWCLNDLAEIHECHEVSDQMVIPIFYAVDPSHVRKLTGEFGKAFDVTCKGKTEDHIDRWKKALAKVAGIAGYDSQNWSGEAEAIEIISKDVLSKLLFTPSDDFRDFVGIEAHIEKMKSLLCLESGGVRMVGIVGPSGIGKTTIARALYSRLSSSQFDHRAFLSYKRTIQDRKIADFCMKLTWVKHFLSEILCQKDIKIESLGMVEQRLKRRKVLIVLDDVDEIELLETLVGRIGWFGFGTRISVVTQDRALLKSHEIEFIHEVQFPSEYLALQMFCQSTFGKTSPPDGFMKLAAEVANISGNLPLGLNVMGSSLRGKDQDTWVEMMPRLRNGLNGKIHKTLRVSYDGLDEKDDQDIFLHIACLFNGERVKHIKNLLGSSVTIGLQVLADKSLIRLTPPCNTVHMHTLLEKLGREIVRAESTNPGKRRFLVDAKDISDVFEDNTGSWSSFSTKYLVELIMRNSELENLWEGAQPLQSLKVMNIAGSRHLKEIPDLSNATNLEILNLCYCTSLVTLHSSIRYLKNLRELSMEGCSTLEALPTNVNLESLDYLDLRECSRLRSVPQISRNISKLVLDGKAMEEEDCLWIENLSGLTLLDWANCPLKFETAQEHSNSLCGQTAVNSGSMAQNLELSLGIGETARVASRSKVRSPSISSGNFHGDEAFLNLSLSPFDQCLERESLYFDPMITEQLDTWTSSKDTSLSSFRSRVNT